MDNFVFYASTLGLGVFFVWAMIPAVQILVLVCQGYSSAIPTRAEVEQIALERVLARVGKGAL